MQGTDENAPDYDPALDERCAITCSSTESVARIAKYFALAQIKFMVDTPKQPTNQYNQYDGPSTTIHVLQKPGTWEAVLHLSSRDDDRPPKEDEVTAACLLKALREQFDIQLVERAPPPQDRFDSI